MSYVILIFGILIMLIGAIILVKPETVLGILRDHFDVLTIHVLAVVVRIILGVALISYAGQSKYPIVLEVLGWISLAAALVLGVIGRSNFKRLMKWTLDLASSYSRVGGFFAVLFGSFLVYAV
ncbi:MAG: hypothetical protein OEQ39_01275 [Gammaproteobacteria bacterium]|nr:hypothetical protein [Gammaproteobacteria bacterium]MDH3465757.1 hypothetical protein [Gammaproteobacteria bacterium]